MKIKNLTKCRLDNEMTITLRITDKVKMNSVQRHIRISNTNKYEKFMFFWVLMLCGLIMDTNILEKCTVSIALKKETVYFSKTLVSAYEFTWHDNPDEQHRHLHHCENCKSHKCEEDGFLLLSYLYGYLPS
jgi:hypothetical protein